MASLTRALARFLGNDFLEEESPSEANPKRMTALDADGDTLAAVLFTGEDALLHARVSGNDLVFVVTEFQVDRVVPELTTLRPEEEPNGSQ